MGIDTNKVFVSIQFPMKFKRRLNHDSYFDLSAQLFPDREKPLGALPHAHGKCKASRFLTRSDSLAALAPLAAASGEPLAICYPHASPALQERRRCAQSKTQSLNLSSVFERLLVALHQVIVTIASMVYLAIA